MKTTILAPYKQDPLHYFKRKRTFQLHLDKKHHAARTALRQVPISLPKNPTLFYAGSGEDILLPLLILDGLEANDATIILADKQLHPDIVAGYVQQLTGCIHRKTTKNTHTFAFRDRTLTITYLEQDIVLAYPNVTYDIYLERGFQLFRKSSHTYLQKAINQLNKNGLLISDYLDIPLKRIPTPDLTTLGFYKNFSIYTT